jgi:hypothetical protein
LSASNVAAGAGSAILAQAMGDQLEVQHGVLRSGLTMTRAGEGVEGSKTRVLDSRRFGRGLIVPPGGGR